MSDGKEAPAFRAHVGREQQFSALGREWTLGRWELAQWRELLDWARPKIPDPKKAAAEFLSLLPAPTLKTVNGVPVVVNGVPVFDDPCREQKNEIVRVALADSTEYLAPNSAKVLALLNGIDGMSHLFAILLKAAHPEVTDDDAYAIVMSIGQAEAERLSKGAAGVAPPPKVDAESPDSPPSNSARPG